MSDYKNDAVYNHLKAAKAASESPYEKEAIQSVITLLRHECAWADPDSPLHQVPGANTSTTLVGEKP